jgi:hypothetical protein
MAEELDEYKRDHQPPTKGDIATLVEALRQAK